MINNNIADTISSQGIVSSVNIGTSPSETHVANHDIMRINPYRFTRNTNTVARGSLPGNGNIGRSDTNGAFQMNNTSYIKYDNTCTPLFTGFAKGPRAAVCQTRNHIYFTTTPAKRKRTTSFSAGKGRYFCLWKIFGFTCPRDIGLSIFRFFLDNRKCFSPS